MKIADAILQGKGASEKYSDTPNLDSQVLIAHITGQPRSWILAHPEEVFPLELEVRFSGAINQIKAGVPLPYVLGEWEFYNHTFELTPDVLIPRPETELLVELAEEWLVTHPESRQTADIGTGSGCIAISLAVQVPDLQVVATDISEAALDVAQANAARYKVNDRVSFVRANLLEPVDPSSTQIPTGGFDLITANLPYIPTEDLYELDVYKREPQLALDGGMVGLDLIRRLLETIPPVLKPKGLILLEIEANQGENAIELTRVHFPTAEISLHSDLGGNDRLLSIQT